MNDWAEGHHALKELVKDLYEAMLWQRTTNAREICDKIVVEARLTKAQIGAQSDNQ